MLTKECIKHTLEKNIIEKIEIEKKIFFGGGWGGVIFEKKCGIRTHVTFIFRKKGLRISYK